MISCVALKKKKKKTLVYFLRLTLFISKYMGSIKKLPADCWFHTTTFVHQVTRVSHTRVVPWSQGGSSSRFAGHGQQHPIYGRLLSWRGSRTQLKRKRLPQRVACRSIYKRGSTLIRLHRTTEVHFLPLCCMEIKAEFCTPDIRMNPLWICGLTLPSLY